MRAKAHDPNCPIGHYALSENERLAALNGAQKSKLFILKLRNINPS